jgi:hypothetical protein
MTALSQNIRRNESLSTGLKHTESEGTVMRAQPILARKEDSPTINDYGRFRVVLQYSPHCAALPDRGKISYALLYPGGGIGY